MAARTRGRSASAHCDPPRLLSRDASTRCHAPSAPPAASASSSTARSRSSRAASHLQRCTAAATVKATKDCPAVRTDSGAVLAGGTSASEGVTRQHPAARVPPGPGPRCHQRQPPAPPLGTQGRAQCEPALLLGWAQARPTCCAPLPPHPLACCSAAAARRGCSRQRSWRGQALWRASTLHRAPVCTWRGVVCLAGHVGGCARGLCVSGCSGRTYLKPFC